MELVRDRIHRQLSQVYEPNVMSKQTVRRWCMMRAVGGHPCGACAENRGFTITELSSHFPLLDAQNCHGAPVVYTIVRYVVVKATDIRKHSKDIEVSIGISAAVL